MYILIYRPPEYGHEFVDDAVDARDEDVGHDRVANGTDVVREEGLDQLAHLKDVDVD